MRGGIAIYVGKAGEELRNGLERPGGGNRVWLLKEGKKAPELHFFKQEKRTEN